MRLVGMGELLLWPRCQQSRFEFSCSSGPTWRRFCVWWLTGSGGWSGCIVRKNCWIQYYIAVRDGRESEMIREVRGVGGMGSMEMYCRRWIMASKSDEKIDAEFLWRITLRASIRVTENHFRGLSFMISQKRWRYETGSVDILKKWETHTELRACVRESSIQADIDGKMKEMHWKLRGR